MYSVGLLYSLFPTLLPTLVEGGIYSFLDILLISGYVTHFWISINSQNCRFLNLNYSLTLQTVPSFLPHRKLFFKIYIRKNFLWKFIEPWRVSIKLQGLRPLHEPPFLGLAQPFERLTFWKIARIAIFWIWIIALLSRGVRARGNLCRKNKKKKNWMFLTTFERKYKIICIITINQ